MQNYTAKYDGKNVQVSGNSQYDTIAIKQVNANTLTDERKKTSGSYKGRGSHCSFERRPDDDHDY
jgi:hypothetical protein